MLGSSPVGSTSIGAANSATDVFATFNISESPEGVSATVSVSVGCVCSVVELGDIVLASAGQSGNTFTFETLEVGDGAVSQVFALVMCDIAVLEYADNVSSNLAVQSLGTISCSLNVTELAEGVISSVHVYTNGEGASLPAGIEVRFKNPKYKITFKRE